MNGHGKKVRNLEPGASYLFTKTDVELPTGEIVRGDTLRRVFLGTRTLEGLPFIEVARDNGKTHLISCAFIAAIRRCDKPKQRSKLL